VPTPSEREVGYQQEPDDHSMSEPLDTDGDGEDDTVIAQEPVGAENVAGGGEFPDPDTPPQPPAPGSAPDRSAPEV
jgi:hypothetical protein